MTFDEWWNNWSVKDWNDIESAKNLFQQAFEAGLHADVHTDNSKVIQNFESQIEKMKSCVNCRYCINEECPWQPKGCGMKHWELRR